MVIIGELFNKGLVHSNVINKGIIKRLLEKANLSAIEIEALCHLLKTCGRTMSQSDNSRKLTAKYIAVMKKHAVSFDFRIQVIVDDVEEMQNNGWKLRIKKETAKTLDEIQKEHNQQNQRNKPHHFNKRANNHYMNNHKFSSHKNHSRSLSDDELKQKTISLIRDCFWTENLSKLVAFLQSNKN